MKKTALLILLCLFCLNLFSQSVTLTKQKNSDVMEFLGTTTISPAMTETMNRHIKKTNSPNTFKSSVFCEFDFSDNGRGKIWNITNNLIKMRITCIDGDNIKENILILEVKPRTFSRIMFERLNTNGNAVYRKIKCELIRQ